MLKICYKYFILSLVLVLCISSLKAQYIGTGQEPPGIDWKEINTEHFKVVFPQKIESEAQRVANTLEYQYHAINKTMAYDAKPITLLLTTEGAIANGYVAMAPRRSEWFATPITVGADDGDWYNLLAVHEVRHIVQFDKIMNRGFNMILGYIFGETLPYTLSSVLVPYWFWEGDAVLLETSLTRGGRGRDPRFDIGIRSLELSHIRYSYSKAVLGSYKDYFPDHYTLGYLLVTHVRRNYEANSWANIVGRSSFFTWYPFAFSGSAAGIIKRRVAGIYDDSLNELKSLWSQQQDSLRITPAKKVNPENNTYTNYAYPQETLDGSVIARKSGISDPQHLVRITDDGKEGKITDTFAMTTFSYGSDKITWGELSFDPRWTKRNYSDIVIFDLKKENKRKITSKGKYFTPALSPDSRRVAAIENSPERKSTLTIFDTESGEILNRAPNPYNESLRQPSWSVDGKAIVFTQQYTEGKALSIYYPDENRIKQVIPHCWQGIMNPIFYNDYILFNSFYSGIDNIYAVDIKTSQTYQVTSRPYGAYNPSVSQDGSMLLFNDYTIHGADIVTMLLDTATWIPTELVKDRTVRYYEPVIKGEQGGDIYTVDNIPTKEYDVSNYSLWKNALNFHSWSLVGDTLTPGFMIVSQDIMNTTTLGLGVYYNRNEHELGGELSLSYAGLYPIIDTYLSRQNRTTTYKLPDKKHLNDTWAETTAAMGLRIPLTFLHGAYQRQISMALYIQATNIDKQLQEINGISVIDDYELSNGVFYPVWYQLSLTQVKQYVRKDIKPQFAQVFNFLYRYTPFKGDYRGTQFSAEAVFFFPSIFKHHSIWFKGNYEQQDAINYRFPSVLDFPRGYKYSYYDRFYLGSVNYSLPLLYPEIYLGGYFYLKRVKTNLFYDHGIGEMDDDKKIYQSAGFELLFDHHWFLLPIELEMGWRFSYKFKENVGFSEFVFQLPLY